MFGYSQKNRLFHSIMEKQLTATDLLFGYYNGIFPMSEPDGQLYWYAPDPRAVIPIHSYQPSKSLKPILNKGLFEIRINKNFRAVMEGCAQPRQHETDTWISPEIIDAYTELHLMGFAHSIEAYIEDQLVGGLYGVAIGKAFFGESMFYTVANASKVCFHFLIEILKENKFELLDTQFINDNVRRYGAIEISKVEYIKRLKKAVAGVELFENVV
jgi:leucyl/phenylalanyl-tRNA---protein transferase